MVKKPLTLTIDEDLIEWIKEYAEKRRITVSHIFNQYIAQLKTKEEKDQTK